MGQIKVGKSWCIIPARAGSKRIANKNTKDFLGDAILKRVIHVAIDSQQFDNIVVSTDSEKAADIAVKSGVRYVEREKSLCDDHTTSTEVIVEFINNYMIEEPGNSIVCCLYPTAVFCTKELLEEGRLLAQKPNKRYSHVYAATEYGHPIQRAIYIDKDGMTKMRDSEMSSVRTQDLEVYYHDCGMFYTALKDDWLRNRKILEGGKALIVDRSQSVDIDTESDWMLAESLYTILSRKYEMGI